MSASSSAVFLSGHRVIPPVEQDGSKRSRCFGRGAAADLRLTGQQRQSCCLEVVSDAGTGSSHQSGTLLSLDRSMSLMV